MCFHRITSAMQHQREHLQGETHRSRQTIVHIHIFFCIFIQWSLITIGCLCCCIRHVCSRSVAPRCSSSGSTLTAASSSTSSSPTGVIQRQRRRHLATTATCAAPAGNARPNRQIAVESLVAQCLIVSCILDHARVGARRRSPSDSARTAASHESAACCSRSAPRTRTRTPCALRSAH
jgi:hypothetical protein